METPNKEPTNDTSRPDLTAETHTPVGGYVVPINKNGVPSLKEKLTQDLAESVRNGNQSFVP